MMEFAGVEIEMCAWIPSDTPELNLKICYLAHADIGIQEIPPGSNRSPYIDSLNRDCGVPVGSYWCAAWVRRIYKNAGADYPSVGAAGCDEWMKWAKKMGYWMLEPCYGAAVVYGKKKPLDANHIGIVTRLSPILTSVEGNTSTGGSFTRNGTAVWPKEVASSRVLGYIWPHPRAA